MKSHDHMKILTIFVYYRVQISLKLIYSQIKRFLHLRIMFPFISSMHVIRHYYHRLVWSLFIIYCH